MAACSDRKNRTGCKIAWSKRENSVTYEDEKTEIEEMFVGEIESVGNIVWRKLKITTEQRRFKN